MLICDAHAEAASAFRAFAIANSMAGQMRLLAEEKSLSMLCEVARGTYVDGDRPWLKQVIVNLIDNAIKYTPEGGEIEIRVRPSQNTAVLEVVDSGVGISAESLPHLFERFYRADKARSRNSGGAGLGLAIVKAICSAHGAEIKIVSSEGRGSSFSVELPLTAPAADPQILGGGVAVSGRRN